MLKKIELIVNRTSRDKKELMLSIIANSPIFYYPKSVYDEGGSATYHISEIDIQNINSIIGVDEYFRGKGDTCVLIIEEPKTVTELFEMEEIYKVIKQTIDEYNASIEEINQLAKL